MSRIITAFRAFFGTLGNADTARRIDAALSGSLPAVTAAPSITPAPAERLAPLVVAPPPAPKQSEALTLLATLQREARLVDFLREDLSQYTDDQIGAAVREVHRDAGKVLDRLFALVPVVADREEGDSLSIPAGFDAGRYRLTGKVSGNGPFTGTLRHHGWEATRCELPVFTGAESAAKTVAPAEVEIG